MNIKLTSVHAWAAFVIIVLACLGWCFYSTNTPEARWHDYMFKQCHDKSQGDSDVEASCKEIVGNHWSEIWQKLKGIPVPSFETQPAPISEPDQSYHQPIKPLTPHDRWVKGNY